MSLKVEEGCLLWLVGSVVARSQWEGLNSDGSGNARETAAMAGFISSTGKEAAMGLF